MDKRLDAMSIFPSFGFQYAKGKKYGGNGINMWHPGFAWACTRTAYERMGGLYQQSILGSGDHNMAFAFLGNAAKSVNECVTEDYKQSIIDFQEKVTSLRLGYIPGVIRHFFHGSKKNRKYSERWQILVNHCYSPLIHLTTNKDGLLIPTAECPAGLLSDILTYFGERNEDEGYKDA